MKKLVYNLLFVIMLGSLVSCQQRMFFPDRANTPGLREAYEAKLTLSFKPQGTTKNDSGNTMGNASSFAADLAFAPAEHFLVFGSYRGLNGRYMDEGKYRGEFDGHRWEGGIGYFTRFDRVGKFELLLGYGGGKVERSRNSDPIRNFNAKYQRIFLQPALGVGNHMYSVTGGVKFAYQRYSDFQSRDSSLKYNILNTDNHQNIESETMAFVEPFINGEVGWKYIKYNMQIGFSGQVMGGNVNGAIPFYISFGLAFNLAPSYFNGGEKAEKNRED